MTEQAELIEKQPVARPTWPLLLLLAVAWVLIDLTVFSVVRLPNVRSAMSPGETVLVWGLIFGQLAALVGWTALGCETLFIRLGIGTCGSLLLIFIGLIGEYQTNWLAISGAYVVLSLCGMIAMRLSGATLSPHLHMPSAKPWQFSIFQIFSITSLVALVLGAMRWAKSSLKGSLPSDPIEFALVELTISSLPCILWPTFFLVPPRFGIPMLIAIPLLLAMIAGAIEGGEHYLWFAFVSLIAIVLCLSLVVIQVAGLRLHWQGRSTE